MGQVYALVVFLADDFVTLRSSSSSSSSYGREESGRERGGGRGDFEEAEEEEQGNKRRFFRMASQLPLDLQMVLCNRVFGSPKDIIHSRDSEPGFRLLTRTTTWQ